MRIPAAGALAIAVIALAIYAVRQQQAANHEILSRLGDVQSALREQAARAGDLAGQVTALAERIDKLEIDNRDLRRQVAMLLRRQPADVAILTLPRALDAVALAPFAAPSIAVAEPIIVEPIPITWATDWSSYQPAGIVAPAPGIVLQRRLTDRAFVRKLYYGYAALQFTDGLTTLVSVNRGAREANPFMQHAARNPAAMIGLKAATIAGTVYAFEKIRKNHPVVATASLIAVNVTLGVVAVNNVTVAARPQPR
jgi:hypothetical protein